MANKFRLVGLPNAPKQLWKCGHIFVGPQTIIAVRLVGNLYYLRRAKPAERMDAPVVERRGKERAWG